MRRFATSLVLGSTIVASLVLVAGSASAQDPKKKIRHYTRYPAPYVNNEGIAQPPLTVNKRSFLDPGPVVPQGSESNYVVQNTYFAQTPDQNFARSKFGNEALPQPLEVPGRPSPVLEFWTPAYPYPYPY
ncbi:hypothetical protein [Methyloferula stellata]|uniref:hypothetical protein n=1 Tax=Methyloferula stellata TaxID=876270 RepID=UPI00037984BF|nr:hypothetical protein [Methyloferula stellata]